MKCKKNGKFSRHVVTFHLFDELRFTNLIMQLCSWWKRLGSPWEVKSFGNNADVEVQLIKMINDFFLDELIM